MIALETGSPLTPRQRYGLNTLLDLSRLLPAEGSVDQVVTLKVIDAAPAEPVDLARCHANGWYLRKGEGEVGVSTAALDLLADVAGAGAEQRATETDRFERVPSSCNSLVAAGLEREPVVSLAAASLRQAVLEVAGRRPVRLLQPWPNGKRWAAAVTHDVDVMRWWPLFSALRLAELLKKGEIGRATSVLAASSGSVLGGSPIGRALAEVLRSEAEHGVRSTWFFLCGTPTASTIAAGDLTYVPEAPAVRRWIDAIALAGHEIGLHGSFETLRSRTAFSAQRSRLAQLSGAEVRGVRQHYLRMRPGATQREMRAAGFAYDATYGFPDRNGFRLGVADPVLGWDDGARRETDLETVPLIWMDRALSKYRGVEDPDAWIDDAVELARRCQAVDGLWVGLWHPNLTPALGFPGADAAFLNLLRRLGEADPWTATLGEICDWRRARRSVRALGIRPDGTVDARCPAGPNGLVPALEDGSRTPRDAVSTQVL